MFTKIHATYKEYPREFWVLSLTAFIDQVGSFMLMPFISLYFIDKFDAGLTEVGLIFTLVAFGNFIGGFVGGAMVDKFGRKIMMLYGLIVSAGFNLLILVINQLNILYIVMGLMGIMGAIGGPARSAMLSDLLSPQQRADGFGILRVMANLAATIGPALGGLFASYDFAWLFIIDAISSGVTALFVIFIISETKPAAEPDAPQETMKQTLGGYKEVFKDWKFLLFVGVTMLMSLVYMQYNSTLSVYLNQEHGFQPQMFGYLMMLNAGMVVIFQFMITRKIKKLPALIMMAVGNLFYAVGFGSYGFVSTVPLFFLSMIIITVGEMIVSPFSQTVAANFAPEDKRGRYMAVFGWAYLIPHMMGVLGAGLIMDNMNPNIVWYVAGGLSIITVVGYLILHGIMKDKFVIKTDHENKNDIPLEKKTHTEENELQEESLSSTLVLNSNKTIISGEAD